MTEPKPLSRGEQYRLRSELDEAVVRLVKHSPLSVEWRAELAEIVRITELLVGNVTTSPGEPECKPSDAPNPGRQR